MIIIWVSCLIFQVIPCITSLSVHRLCCICCFSQVFLLLYILSSIHHPVLKILVFYFLNDKKLTESRSCSGSFTFVIIFFCPYPSHLEIYLHFKSSDISLFPSSFKKSISVLFNWGFVTESPGSVRSVKVTNFFSPISYLPSIPCLLSHLLFYLHLISDQKYHMWVNHLIYPYNIIILNNIIS